MEIVLTTPTVEEIPDILAVLRDWQQDNAPAQLHPGDIGWHGHLDDEDTANAIRSWTKNGEVMAIALLESPDMLQLTINPAVRQDAQLAQRLAEDIMAPQRGVLPKGKVFMDAPTDANLLHELLNENGWINAEPRVTLVRELTLPVPDSGLRIEVVVNTQQGHIRNEVQRSAFNSTRFTDERWKTMTNGPAYTNARCLVAYDIEGTAVAMATVWSAGPGNPGLLEPMGVHASHQGRGFGKSMCLAAAVELQRMGSSSIIVGLQSCNVGAVATYKSAGFEARPEVWDKWRPSF